MFTSFSKRSHSILIPSGSSCELCQARYGIDGTPMPEAEMGSVSLDELSSCPDCLRPGQQIQ